jgi:NADPH-dependent 2,4-dienoyl-CoA reductase/sulfur reductase-like enzyme
MHVVIIGNGITGVTAARAIRKAKPRWRITMISAESEYHWSRPALMYVYLGHMTREETEPYPPKFWTDNRIDLLRAHVSGVDVESKLVKVVGGVDLRYDKLLVATGSQPNRFGWKGQDLARVQGMYSLQDLELLEQNSIGLKQAVIVGGGLIGVEMAEMLHSRGVHVVFLVREESYWSNILPPEESALITNLFADADGIDLRLGTELTEIVGNERGEACAVITSMGDRVECQLVGLTAGVRPNLSAVRHSDIATGRGVLVDERLKTNAPDVWAAGDCAEIVPADGSPHWSQQVWYTGRLQAEAAAASICGTETTYDKGIWFNSAKFLDVEWQTYGWVPGKPLDEETHLYWESSDRKKCLRLVFDADGAFTAMNVIGIRYRHRVCEGWIRDGLGVDQVLDRLSEGNFDPEFSRRHEGEIVAHLRGQQ